MIWKFVVTLATSIGLDLKSMSRLIDGDQLMHILNEENPNPKEQQQVMFFLAQDIYSKP